jgi:hypothetical protein
MIKPQTSKYPIPRHAIAKVVAVLGIVVLLLLFAVVSIAVNVSILEERNYVNVLKLSREQSQLVFCVDRSIRPCDGTSIGEWNSSNPDDQLRVEAIQND